MGGGSMFRSAARFVGAAATAGAASAPAGAFCHVSASSLRPPPEQLSSSSDLAHKEARSASALTSRSDWVVRHDDLEDWEYPTHEEWTERSRSHLVFSPAPPTEDEVEEATKELHAALHLSIPVSNSILEGNSNDPCSRQPAIASCHEQMETLISDGEGQEISDRALTHSSILSSHLGTLAAESSSVYQAFVLMQTNPQVQGVVKSLASDPAVWKAVLSNEKMQELTHSLQDSDEMLSNKKSLPSNDENEELNVGFATKIIASVSEKVLQFMDKIVEIVSALFGSVEKTLSSKGIGDIDKTVASCMMLAVAVLLIVVLKRIPCK